jgi:hypothetical protein
MVNLSLISASLLRCLFSLWLSWHSDAMFNMFSLPCRQNAEEDYHAAQTTREQTINQHPRVVSSISSTTNVHRQRFAVGYTWDNPFNHCS